MRCAIVVLACAVMLGAFAVPCQPEAAKNCGPYHVWVPGFETPDGGWVEGYCRPKAKPGLRWVDTHQSPSGHFVPAHWEPLGHPPPGKNWIPGHYGPKGRWVPGHWK